MLNFKKSIWILQCFTFGVVCHCSASKSVHTVGKSTYEQLNSIKYFRRNAEMSMKEIEIVQWSKMLSLIEFISKNRVRDVMPHCKHTAVVFCSVFSALSSLAAINGHATLEILILINGSIECVFFFSCFRGFSVLNWIDCSCVRPKMVFALELPHCFFVYFFPNRTCGRIIQMDRQFWP